MATPRSGTLERDLRVITVHRVLRRTPFWMPVFFLYFTERFSGSGRGGWVPTPRSR